jgi:hypothetical protein
MDIIPILFAPEDLFEESSAQPMFGSVKTGNRQNAS